MPINCEFLQLQFDTKQSSVLRKKYPRKKEHASGLPTLHGHGKQRKELGENPSVLFVKANSADPDPQPQNTASDQGIHCSLILTERSIKMKNATQHPLKRKWSGPID